MKALQSRQQNEKVVTELADIAVAAPKAREVKIKVQYSSINYKDALGVTGAGRIFKKLPIIGGIDAAGEVVESQSEKFKAGDPVLVTGCGLGETHDGGYAEYVIESEENVVPREWGHKPIMKLTARQAMIFGTAGFTAELALARMLQNGQTPTLGPILVTGASGGVGQFAIRAFSRAGFEVHALTGKKELRSRLEKLGAKRVVSPKEVSLKSRPLESIEYGGAVDNLGGKTLAAIIARVQLWGNVASIGLADSAELQTTVMPMILRGVSLLGISSNNCSRDLRLKLWQKLAAEISHDSSEAADLDQFVTDEVSLEKVVNVSQEMLARKIHGRVLVKI